MRTNFDLIIVGGGHAGLEAAWISAELGLNVGLLSMPGIGLGSTPCNPAVGGVGKGQVVREIDSLGGIMGKISDLSAIQYRTLNESKGYAVQSTRVQVDKDLYTENADKIIRDHANIEVLLYKASKINKQEETFYIETSSNIKFSSKALIITTGTFLNGALHTGFEKTPGGRVGVSPAKGLGELFDKVKALPSRFKTGTPPRLKKSSIDFSKMEAQPSDVKARNFHSLHETFSRAVPQIHCHLTRTNQNTLTIIRDNKENSPLFNGQIKGVGPRYCPSIEDKAFRYPEKNSHHVFVEPEGLNTESIYPNGVSTSLPKEIQEEFIRTIPGLEDAEILVSGYAVEYDVVDTTYLNGTLEHQDIPGLYFAGQVNGTSGYEEAAGQGIVAGMNAGLKILGKDPVILDRNDSYIGVMIEDLISNRRDEPYRLFTARAENRLMIREDNTILRMRKYREALGLSKEVDQYQERFLKHHDILWDLCKRIKYDEKELQQKEFFKLGKSGFGKTNLVEVLKRTEENPVDLLLNELKSMGVSFMEPVVYTVTISLIYEGYIKRAVQEREKVSRLAKKSVDWKKLITSKNISTECKQRIQDIRPETFSQLKNIEGIRPATLVYVASNLA